MFPWLNLVGMVFLAAGYIYFVSVMISEEAPRPSALGRPGCYRSPGNRKCVRG